MHEVECLEQQLLVVEHDLEQTRRHLTGAIERINSLEQKIANILGSIDIYETQHPDRVRLARLERAVAALVTEPGSPYSAAKAARDELECRL